VYNRLFYQIENNKLVLKEERLRPKLTKNEILVEVKAAGINRADLLHVEGKYLPQNGDLTPGLEISGIDLATGQEICGLLPSGGYSSHVAINKALTFPKPKNFSFAEAACLPEALITVWLNLFVLGKLKPQQKILIHTGASGIGSFAIKVAKLIDATVITTASSKLKQQFCHQELKADFASDYDNFPQICNDLGGVDLVLDILGGNYLNANINCLKFNATIILLAVMNGSHANIHLGKVLMKNLKIIGSTLRNKTLAQKAKLIRDAYSFFNEQQGEINLHPVMHAHFPFIEAIKAHQLINANINLGKIGLVF
jgi:NADPH:quinone reductase-like Zn-dependent oxidoreductase